MATKATGSKKNMVDETTPKKGSKSVTSKKKTNILKNIWTFICTHKVIFSILTIIILIIIFTLLFLKLSLSFTEVCKKDAVCPIADKKLVPPLALKLLIALSIED